jgi:UDP-N-acetylmuramoyl-tripeptide--D-alanyl-D-alanine ligase
MEIEKLYELYRSCSGITTDSRSAGRNQIFFALRGPNHDGNRHAYAALEAGAMAAVVDDSTLSGGKIVLVNNVMETLTALAAFHRRRLRMPVIAVTGSNGKTTTKELLTAVLSKKGKVQSTFGNFNNHIGVPLTILNVPEDAGFLVVEMGANHMGEIAGLCETAMPTHGIITNIGTAHIEGFGSFEKVREAKSELYRWLGKNGGTAIYNDDDPVLKPIIGMVDKIVPYSFPAGMELKVNPVESNDMYLKVSASVGDRKYEFGTGLFGIYNVDNIRAVMAAGLLFGVPLNEIVDAVSSYTPANNRSQIVDTGNNTVIHDAYNANPTSMQKAIASFAAVRSDKKMVILGDMLELGSESETGHAAVISQLRSLGPLMVVLVGPRFRKASGELTSHLFGSSAEAAEWLAAEKPRGFTILVKGSRGMMLEKVYPLL